MNKISLWLIPLMMVLYVISYLDRINISFAALQMNKDLNFSDEAYSFGAGIFFVGYCIFGIPSNLIIERFGPRKWVAAIMIVWGLMTIGFCQVRTPLEFHILRFLLGIAEAGFFPGMILYLTYWFPSRFYGGAVAKFMTAIPLAGILGSLIASQALGMKGVCGLAGWMWLFIVTGIPAVLMGILVLFLMPDGPHQARWLTGEEKEHLENMLSPPVDSSPESTAGGETATEGNDQTRQATGKSTPDAGSAFDKFLGTVRDFSVWHCALLYFSLTVSMYGFQLWLPQIIKAFGSSNDSTTALLSAIPAVFQALGMLIIATNSDRTGERRYHVMIASAITFSGLILSCVSDIIWIKFAGLCLAAFGIWGSVGPFWALTKGTLRASSQVTGIAIINSIGNLGGFAGPVIVGYIKQQSKGFADSLIALAVASVLAALLAFSTRFINKSSDD